MTTKFVAPTTRVETAKGHYYKDGNGNRIPGVTTILGDGVPKPALINWAANATAEYAVDHWDELGDLSPSARLKTLQGARYTTTDKAKKRGTEVHAYAEQLVKGEQVEGVPDELRGHVEAYARFLNDFDVDPILVESAVVSYRYGYAGTLDLIAEVTDPHGYRCRMLLDVKTNEKGIFGETALQLAAYRYADYYLSSDGELPVPEVVACGAILVSSDTAQLIPVTANEDQMKSFRIAAAMRDFVAGSRDLVGSALQPHQPKPTIAHIVYKEAS